MTVLGYAALNHDPSIAVIQDGKILCAIESEKVTRHKHEVSTFPETAIRFALGVSGIEWGELDAIAVNYDAGFLACRGYLPQMWHLVAARSWDSGVLLNAMVIGASHHRRVFQQSPEYRIPPIVRVRHHLAHLGSAFPYSPFDESAVAIFDASGELECTSLYWCAERKIRKLYSLDLPTASLGFIYMMATRYLGYRGLGDEYKVMGLAPYGEGHPRFRRFFTELIQLLPEGRYRVDRNMAGKIFDNGWKFPENTVRLLGPARQPGEEVRQEQKDFAFELQNRLQDTILHVIRHVHRLTGSKSLCMAGGVALNSVANGKVLQEGPFQHVFVPPAPHDAGTSLGAATYHTFYSLRGPRPECRSNPFLGPSYTEDQIESDLARCRQVYRRVENPALEGARHLAAGRVVGWFQGRTEFGARALGNRSILADPRKAEMGRRINSYIKEREGFRPLAPAVLESHAALYFPRLRHSPYMAFVDQVIPERRQDLAATVHVDGSARAQVVERGLNPLFYDLISHFHRLTGVPAVLNTSFNVAGEPIVNTPLDALRCFHGSGLDVVIIGSFVLEKAHSAGFSQPLPHGG